MKRKFYPLLSGMFLMAGITTANAQGGVYFREGFEEGTGWPSSVSDAAPLKKVTTTTSGDWWTFGCYRTNGPTGSCPTQTGGLSHIRFGKLSSISGGGYTAADSAYLLTPLATNGIYDLAFINGRAGRRITIYKTYESDEATTNWSFVEHFPATNAACDAFTVMINDINAKRLKIISRSETDSDLDTMVMRSVGVLPTRFGSLTLQQRNDEVVANWEAFNESNLKGYYLQRSTDGNSFADVSFVAPKNSLMADYTAVDKIKGSTSLYYRVKSIDLDGKTGYSPVARISVNRQGFDGIVVKNPVRGNSLEIQLNGLKPGTYQVSLNGISGNKIANKSVQVQSESVTVSLQLPSSVGKGVQVLSVTGSNFRQTGKVMVE